MVSLLLLSSPGVPVLELFSLPGALPTHNTGIFVRPGIVDKVLEDLDCQKGEITQRQPATRS
jgi:hypothetical protein